DLERAVVRERTAAAAGVLERVGVRVPDVRVSGRERADVRSGRLVLGDRAVRELDVGRRLVCRVGEGAGDRLADADVDVGDGAAVVAGRARQLPTRRHRLGHAVAAPRSDVRERLLVTVLQAEAGRGQPAAGRE